MPPPLRGHAKPRVAILAREIAWPGARDCRGREAAASREDGTADQSEAAPALLSLQFALQNLSHPLRVRLALAGLHHLPLQEIQGCGFAASEILRAPRVSGDDLVAQFLDRRRVAHLGEPFARDDLAGRFAAGEHLAKNVLRHRAADRAAVDELDQL